MSQTVRSSAILFLALILAVVALAVLVAPNGTDDARRKITLGQTPTAVTQQVSAPAANV